MGQRFDTRVVGPDLLRFLQSCQRRVPFHLAGGAALGGAYLRHRLSNDADLFFHDAVAHRDLVRSLRDLSLETGFPIEVLRDAGSFVRARVTLPHAPVEIDVVHDPVPDVEEPPPPVDGIVVESLADLRANKITCILSRTEPRDLVDLLFLDRAGYPPENDLALALRKDSGIDPGVIAWLLRQFPVAPLPVMLEALDSAALAAFRDDLSERFRRIAVADPPKPSLV
jgi:hypothetical protein